MLIFVSSGVDPSILGVLKVETPQTLSGEVDGRHFSLAEHFCWNSSIEGEQENFGFFFCFTPG